MAEAGFDWAQRFDEDARAVMLDDPTEVAALTGHADFAPPRPP
jgi:4,5-DOPA dioxygenase extradiol